MHNVEGVRAYMGIFFLLEMHNKAYRNECVRFYLNRKMCSPAWVSLHNIQKLNIDSRRKYIFSSNLLTYVFI